MNRKVFKAVGILGLAIAAFAAPRFTTKANVKQTDTIWLQTANGQWVQHTTQSYYCANNGFVCVMRFPEGLTPADGLEFGTVENSNGYAVITAP